MKARGDVLIILGIPTWKIIHQEGFKVGISTDQGDSHLPIRGNTLAIRSSDGHIHLCFNKSVRNDDAHLLAVIRA